MRRRCRRHSRSSSVTRARGTIFPRRLVLEDEEEALEDWMAAAGDGPPSR